MLFNIIDLLFPSYKKDQNLRKSEYHFYYKFFIKWLLIIIIVSLIFIIINNLYYNTLENDINQYIIDNPTTPSNILKMKPNVPISENKIKSLNVVRQYKIDNIPNNNSIFDLKELMENVANTKPNSDIDFNLNL